ncbi:hypothetical protein [Marinilactibacillus psychrotolerans]|uniref:Uncharacterized protein n=1 Tax=Marinilactibacillus psychrotolerans TaxID=191770 RepID=A0AAV3WTN3_9LACT|nr:hypothetical protein [Marinilactibacillus psychrotolerans]GEL67229.1 hypothetical protein MPS01_13840 [Marinilactibacillus psychrotolerans]GEQ36033.1 hypothetical protein M132T_15410 [Marinilactibacillus psychrotolerans]SDC60652.1 hypothetical protein SAMN04488013_10745 [Marinilactibacillus psychrotolerans]
MNGINWNLLLTGVIALTGILSPLATTKINNSHQLKMKNLEIKEEEVIKFNNRKSEKIEDFFGPLSKYATMIKYNSTIRLDQIAEFEKTYYSIIPYLTDSTYIKCKLVYEYLTNVKTTDSSTKKVAIDDLIDSLRKEMK